MIEMIDERCTLCDYLIPFNDPKGRGVNHYCSLPDDECEWIINDLPGKKEKG